MKHSIVLILILLCTSIGAQKGIAQQSENRIKMQLTIHFQGKDVTADLTGVSTSFSRNPEMMDISAAASTPSAATDTAKLAIPDYYGGTIYLGLDAYQINDDLLRVFAKKQNRFDGKITMVDTYGRTPDRTITFKNAAVQSFSQQMSGYGESYGNSAMTFSCQEIAVNGILIEQ